MYVCMYVHHAFGMQLRLHACAMYYYLCAYLHTCAAACIHVLQLTYLDHNLRPKFSHRPLASNNNYVEFAKNFWLVSDSALSPQTHQSMSDSLS